MLHKQVGPLALGKHRLVESVLSSTAHNVRVTNGPQEGGTEEVACVLLAGEDRHQTEGRQFPQQQQQHRQEHPQSM